MILYVCIASINIAVHLGALGYNRIAEITPSVTELLLLERGKTKIPDFFDYGNLCPSVHSGPNRL